MSQTTKKALAASLKKLLSVKPLDKITVVDIAEDCQVNRQTFYYHFQDIYDLVEWIFLNEATELLGEKNTRETWPEALQRLFHYIIENKSLILNTYRSAGRDHLTNYLYDVTFRFLLEIVEEEAANMSVNEEDKRFIADFYKYALVGMTLDWIRRGMREDPDQVIERLAVMMHGNIVAALEKCRADRISFREEIGRMPHS